MSTILVANQRMSDRIPQYYTIPPSSIFIEMDFPTIDDLDRRIIQSLAIDPRIPFRQLSVILDGPSEQTIARRYRRLVDASVLKVVAQLNSQRIGRSDWFVRIRCAPGQSSQIANQLAQHRDTSWVRIISGGSEVYTIIRSHDRDRQTPLLLEQLTIGREIIGIDPYCLLHLFASDVAYPVVPSNLLPNEIAKLSANAQRIVRTHGPTIDLHQADLPLIGALSADGRASYRNLALRTHWHESTVRRRVEELIASGVIAFEVDLDPALLGQQSQALLWITTTPGKLPQVGEALAQFPEIPFAAATTGPSNLVAALACASVRELYQFLTHQVGQLDGINNVETTPVLRTVKLHAAMWSVDR
jgi:DNA-binding Lrp family transcriptional regulator